MTPSKQTKKRLPCLLSLLEDASTLLIVLQDNPDPDAIASAAGLRALANEHAVQCFIAHGGVVGRAENRALVKYLGIRLHDLREIDVEQFDLIAMLDTQPGTGNNSLPAEAMPDVVIDHHPVHRLTKSVAYTDVRSRYGSTTTIIYEYLLAENVALDASLATALLYGIKSDTGDLGRNATHRDIDSYLTLYPLANKRALGRIQIGLVPQDYFKMLARGLHNARLFGKAAISGLGDVDNPDMISEMADLLLRNEESTWAMCCGFYEDKALFSLRSLEAATSAGQVAQKLAGRNGTGGGHNVMAGGQIPLKDASASAKKKIEAQLTRRFLSALKIKVTEGQKLV